VIVDNALATFSIFLKMLDGGDTGKRRVEHRSLWVRNASLYGFISSMKCAFE
jgi:hypothetical protein